MYLLNRKRFILDNIEALLKADLSPVNIEATLSKQPLAELQLLLDSSGLTAVDGLKAFRYQVPGADFQRLCQQNYSDLFRLKDQFQQLQQQECFSFLGTEARAFYVALEAMLNGVQAYLESTGISSLAGEELLPSCYLEGRLALLRRDNDLLKSRLKSSTADAALKDLLMEHFDSFSRRHQVSQQQLQYVEQLMQALLRSLKPGLAEDQDLFLMYKVVKWNFNAPECYVYCRNKILAALEDTVGSRRRLLLLNWQLKAIKQLLCIPSMGLHADYPNLKDLLIELLSTEISYEEAAFSELDGKRDSKRESKVDAAMAGTPASFGVPQGTAKFQLQLTQRVLAIWTQTLIATKILNVGVKGQRRFTEFLADHFTTVGMEDIQPEYFRRRYKEKHTAASEKLIAILEQMILSIKHEYIGINMPAEK
jgi:hypothetical protein